KASLRRSLEQALHTSSLVLRAGQTGHKNWASIARVDGEKRGRRGRGSVPRNSRWLSRLCRRTLRKSLGLSGQPLAYLRGSASALARRSLAEKYEIASESHRLSAKAAAEPRSPVPNLPTSS